MRVHIYPLPLDVVVGILSTEDEKAKLQALSGQIYAPSCIWVSEKTPSRALINTTLLSSRNFDVSIDQVILICQGSISRASRNNTGTVPKTFVFETLPHSPKNPRFYAYNFVSKLIPKTKSQNSTYSMSFGTLVIIVTSMSAEQKKRLLKAKIAVALRRAWPSTYQRRERRKPS